MKRTCDLNRWVSIWFEILRTRERWLADGFHGLHIVNIVCSRTVICHLKLIVIVCRLLLDTISVLSWKYWPEFLKLFSTKVFIHYFGSPFRKLAVSIFGFWQHFHFITRRISNFLFLSLSAQDNRENLWLPKIPGAFHSIFSFVLLVHGGNVKAGQI